MHASTRSANHHDHRLQTPETFVRTVLPGMRRATAIVHASPEGGAAFTQYTVEFEPGGGLPPTGLQRLVYVLDGRVVSGSHAMDRGAFAYFAPGEDTPLEAGAVARVVVFEKPYVDLAGVGAPSTFFGRESEAAAVHPNDDPWLEVRLLIPDTPAFDFRVNTLTYQPGAELPGVEIHVMEHGLLMLDGGGVYRLGDRWYPVEAGDFIWMAPYCPQWFGAIGKRAARYIIYKDSDRWPGAAGVTA
jgi:(S)-ureidoglycine aminohydrolase